MPLNVDWKKKPAEMQLTGGFATSNENGKGFPVTVRTGQLEDGKFGIEFVIRQGDEEEISIGVAATKGQIMKIYMNSK